MSYIIKISVTEYLSYQPPSKNEFANDFNPFEKKVLATIDHTFESDYKLIEPFHKISQYMKKLLDECNAFR